jgi:hypothetical protein
MPPITNSSTFIICRQAASLVYLIEFYLLALAIKVCLTQTIALKQYINQTNFL